MLFPQLLSSLTVQKTWSSGGIHFLERFTFFKEQWKGQNHNVISHFIMGNLFKHIFVTVYHGGQLAIKCLHLHISSPETFQIPMEYTLDFLSLFLFFLHFLLLYQVSAAARNTHASTANIFVLTCLKTQSLISCKDLDKSANY